MPYPACSHNVLIYYMTLPGGSAYLRTNLMTKFKRHSRSNVSFVNNRPKVDPRFDMHRFTDEDRLYIHNGPLYATEYGFCHIQEDRDPNRSLLYISRRRLS